MLFVILVNKFKNQAFDIRLFGLTIIRSIFTSPRQVEVEVNVHDRRDTDKNQTLGAII